MRALCVKRAGLVSVLTGVAVAALALPLAVTLWGIWGGDTTRTEPPVSDGSLQKVLDAKRLVLGLDVEYPPMGFIDEKGEIVGFDIDTAQEVCNRLGIELIKQPINWDAKEDDLNSGKIDCIWNGMSVSQERAERMNLSEPYVKNELVFVVPGDSGVKVRRDLKSKKIGVQAGSTTQEALETSDIYYMGISVVALDNNVEIMRKLSAGELDAALIDSLVVYYLISMSNERYFVLPDSLVEEKCAIGFRKKDRDLRDKVQEILQDMKADGTLGRISQKWFGSDITIVR